MCIYTLIEGTKSDTSLSATSSTVLSGNYTLSFDCRSERPTRFVTTGFRQNGKEATNQNANTLHLMVSVLCASILCSCVADNQRLGPSVASAVKHRCVSSHGRSVECGSGRVCPRVIRRPSVLEYVEMCWIHMLCANVVCCSM